MTGSTSRFRRERGRISERSALGSIYRRRRRTKRRLPGAEKIVLRPRRWRDASRRYAGSLVWTLQRKRSGFIPNPCPQHVVEGRRRPAYLRSRVRGADRRICHLLRRHVHVLCVAGARGLDCMGEEAPAQVRGGAWRVELPRRLESDRHALPCSQRRRPLKAKQGAI